MTTKTPTQDPPAKTGWRDTMDPAGEGPAADLASRAAAALDSLPGQLGDASETLGAAIGDIGTSVSKASDVGLLMGASLASGVAIGLLFGRGARVLAAAAVITAASLGAALVQRRGTGTEGIAGRTLAN